MITEIEEIIQKNWEELLGKEVGLNDNFFELGGNSYKALISLLKLNEELKDNTLIDYSALTIENILKEGTVFNLSKKLRHSDSESTFYLISENIDPARKNVFFFPPIFGISSVFHDLANRLNANCFAINYQEKGEDLAVYIESVSRYLIDNFKQIDVLIGYSYGGMFSYSIAKFLEQHNQSPEVIIIDASPVIEKNNGINLEIIMEESKYWGIEDVNDSVKSHIQQTIAKRLDLLNRFRLVPGLQSNVRLIFAQENDIYNENLEEYWKAYAKGSLESFSTPGNHYTLIQQDNVLELQKSIEPVIYK